jgi:predicted transcriptional regulator of viral defense system
MRAREWPDRLYDIAENQLGYFTAAQARAAGVHPVRLVQLHQRGDIERVSRGVYRLTRFPLSPLGEYMEAALWPQVRRPGARAVISHVSALALHELSEVSPAKIHITLPPELRIRRAVPFRLVLHIASLTPKDVQLVDGVPVTTPARTIRDAHAANLGPALIRRAIADALRTGRLTDDEAERLTRELLHEAIPRNKRPSTANTAIGARPTKSRRPRPKAPSKRGAHRR